MRSAMQPAGPLGADAGGTARALCTALLLACSGAVLTACDSKVEQDDNASAAVPIDTSTVIFSPATAPESLAFVAMLGTDTVHLERAVMDNSGVIGTVRAANGDSVQYALEANGRFTVQVSGQQPSMTQTTLPASGERCAYVAPSLALLERCIRHRDSLPVGVRVRLVVASVDAEPDRQGSIRRTYDGNVLLELDGDSRFVALDANGRLTGGAAPEIFAKPKSGIVSRLAPKDYWPATESTINALFGSTNATPYWRMQRVPYHTVPLVVPDVVTQPRTTGTDTLDTTP